MRIRGGGDSLLPRTILGGLADYSPQPVDFVEPARIMAAKGATALFVPTNNALPANRARPELVSQARNVDIARAIDNSVSVIRVDVSGSVGHLLSYGSSAIVDSDGRVLQSAPLFTEKLLVADICPQSLQ